MTTLRPHWALAVGLLSLAACKKPAPARTGATPASSLDQPNAAGAAAAGPYVLTSATLDRFLAYQRDMLEVYRGLSSDVSAIAAKADGGSSGVGAKAMGSAVHLLERRARAEEAAREKEKLSSRDVTQIEKMISAVLSKRQLSATLPLDQSIAQFEALEAKLPKAQQPQIEQSIAELKAQKAEVENLTLEKKQFGEANVALILSREKELGAAWNAWVSALTGGRVKPDAAPGLPSAPAPASGR